MIFSNYSLKQKVEISKNARKTLNTVFLQPFVYQIITRSLPSAQKVVKELTPDTALSSQCNYTLSSKRNMQRQPPASQPVSAYAVTEGVRVYEALELIKSHASSTLQEVTAAYL